MALCWWERGCTWDELRFPTATCRTSYNSLQACSLVHRHTWLLYHCIHKHSEPLLESIMLLTLYDNPKHYFYAHQNLCFLWPTQIRKYTAPTTTRKKEINLKIASKWKKKKKSIWQKSHQSSWKLKGQIKTCLCNSYPTLITSPGILRQTFQLMAAHGLTKPRISVFKVHLSQSLPFRPPSLVNYCCAHVVYTDRKRQRRGKKKQPLGIGF